MNLKINHRLGIVDVDFFSNFELTLKYDSVASVFAFGFYFDPKNKTHAELACVSHYHEAIVQHNGETLVTGFILGQAFKHGAVKELAKFGGYSKPGVLEDCEIPPSLYPLQSDGLTLREIVSKLIAPFKLKMVVDSSVASKMDAAIPVSTASVSQNIKTYLTELTTQRGIVMTHNENGDLVFTKAKKSYKPICHFDAGIPGTEITMSFNGQGMHSDITVMKQADSEGGNAGETTIQNPYVPIVYRPKVITQTSGDSNTIEETAKNALAAELKNIVLTIKTDRWEIDGKIIRPDNTITVTDPEVFLYKKTEWFIESVSYTGDAKETTAVLTCVPIEVYNGETPTNMFVDSHENLPRF